MAINLECPLCGTVLDEKKDYCPECGETLRKSSNKKEAAAKDLPKLVL